MHYTRIYWICISLQGNSCKISTANQVNKYLRPVRITSYKEFQMRKVTHKFGENNIPVAAEIRDKSFHCELLGVSLYSVLQRKEISNHSTQNEQTTYEVSS